MSFDRTLSNIIGPVVRGWHYSSPQNLMKKGPAWNHGKT